MRLWVDVTGRRTDEVEIRSGAAPVVASRFERHAVVGVVTDAGTGRAIAADLDRPGLRAAAERAAAAAVPGAGPPVPPLTVEDVRPFADPRPWTCDQLAETVRTAGRELATATAGGRWVVRARAVRENRLLTDSGGTVVREEITRCWLHVRAVTPAGAAAVDGNFARHPDDLRPARLATEVLAALPEGPFRPVRPRPSAIVWEPAPTARLLNLLAGLPAGVRDACLAASAVRVTDDPRCPGGPRSVVFDPDGFETPDRPRPLSGASGPAGNVVLERRAAAGVPAAALHVADLLDARVGHDGTERVIRAAFLGTQESGGHPRPVRGVLTVPVGDVLSRVMAVLGPAKFLHGLGGFDAATLLSAPGPRFRLRDTASLTQTIGKDPPS
jgi:hypothetical protein